VKPEEIALCRDVLLEAGVPQSIVYELTELRDRIQILRITRAIDDAYIAISPGVVEHARRSIYYDLAKGLVDQGVATISERRGALQVEITLSLPVIVPLNWKAQAPAVQR
jgi:hypothetical protein